MPITKEQANAYIQGVLDGDGYIDNCNPDHPRISLCVSNETFAKIFGKMLIIIGIEPTVNHRQRAITLFQSGKDYKYNQHTIYVRASVTKQIIDNIVNAPLDTQEKKAAYIQGFFDSDGSYFKTRYQSIVTFGKARPKLEKIRNILTEFGIVTKLYDYPYNHVPSLKICRKDSVAKFFTLMKPKFEWGLEPEDKIQTTEQKIEKYREWLYSDDLLNVEHAQGLLELCKQQFESLFASVSDKESRKE